MDSTQTWTARRGCEQIEVTIGTAERRVVRRTFATGSGDSFSRTTAP